MELSTPKFGISRQHIYIASHSFWGSGKWEWLCWLRVFHEVAIKVLASAAVIWRGWGIQFQDHLCGHWRKLLFSPSWPLYRLLTGLGIWSPPRANREREIQNGGDIPSLLSYAVGHADQPYYNMVEEYTRVWIQQAGTIGYHLSCCPQHSSYINRVALAQQETNRPIEEQ